jgi:hypothetical protein
LKKFKPWKLLVLMIMLFSLAAPTVTQAATVKGGIIKSTYGACGGTRCYSMEITDIYMKPTEARKYASKNDVSFKQGLGWLGASFIPGAGPYLSVYGFISTNKQQQLSNNIRKYTNKNQSVHVTIMKDSTVTSTVVTKWDGKKTSIKPFKVAQPQLLKIKYKKYKY